jgi:transcriptional regulator with XRE-family HTH domain
MSWRASVKSHLERWIEEQPKVRGRAPSERALAKKLGISSYSINRLRNCEGPMGLYVLARLREKLGVPIDELIGLADWRARNDAIEGRIAREIARREEERAANESTEPTPPESPRPQTRRRV